MYIVNVINSFVGKKGNIGARCGHIIDNLNKANIDNFSYSRGAVSAYVKNNINMSLSGHIPRLLNAYRIYLNSGYNHRKHDIYLFERFFFRNFVDSDNKHKVAHLWEFSPNIISFLKQKGYKIVLDIPIAPTATSFDIISRAGEDVGILPFRYNDKLERRCYEMSDHIISPSNFVTEELLQIGVKKSKISTIYFGTNTNPIKKKYSKKYSSEGIDYCFAGNINKRKGVNILLEAWNSDVFKNDRLHLCGRLYPEIKQLISNSRRGVILPGFVNTVEYFKKCDVYVFPSLLEGSSKSVYEAMSMSLPCIVTPNSGSIVQDEVDGFIVDVLDSEKLRSKMLSFKNNERLIKSMGLMAFENVRNYSWERYSNSVVSLYSRLIN